MKEHVLLWHKQNGGHFGRPASHALRLLREAVELCVESAATSSEIYSTVEEEIYKAEDRGDWGGDRTKVPGECADIGLLLDLITGYLNIDIEYEKSKKLNLLQDRQWEVDPMGVLWCKGKHVGLVRG